MQLTSRSAGSADSAASTPSASASARARSGVRFQTRTRLAPASRSAQAAARALPPAPRMSALRPAGVERQRGDETRRVGVVGGDRAAREGQRVRRADRRRRGRGRVGQRSAPPPCGGSSRWRRRTRRRQRRARSRRADPAGRAGAGSPIPCRPSAASAALCIAGERLWPTGQPSTPRRLVNSADGSLPPRPSRARL